MSDPIVIEIRVVVSEILSANEYRRSGLSPNLMSRLWTHIAALSQPSDLSESLEILFARPGTN